MKAQWPILEGLVLLPVALFVVCTFLSNPDKGVLALIIIAALIFGCWLFNKLTT